MPGRLRRQPALKIFVIHKCPRWLVMPSRRSRPMHPLADGAPGRRPQRAGGHRASGLRWHPPETTIAALIPLRCAHAVHGAGGALRHAASGARARLRLLVLSSRFFIPVFISVLQLSSSAQFSSSVFQLSFPAQFSSSVFQLSFPAHSAGVFSSAFCRRILQRILQAHSPAHSAGAFCRRILQAHSAGAFSSSVFHARHFISQHFHHAPEPYKTSIPHVGFTTDLGT